MKAVMRRGEGGEGSAPAFVPSSEWLDAYIAQATSELIEFANRFARARARKVALLRHLDATYAQDVVEDILGDTLLGVIAWDPDRVSLKKHVLDAIQSRTRHDYVHALKFRPVRLDDPGVHAEVESALADATRHEQSVARVNGDILAALHALAKGDEDVMLLLAALAQLITKKRDVQKHTGLTHKRYDAARKRLHRLTLQLPSHLRDALTDCE